ncbi:MAG TPA: redoxin domain-containing protein [Ignavibacteria bacterium]|nr:redoxin domain-containing protein [Ignavibacteria bacterium]
MALNIGDKAPDFTLPSFTPSAELTNITLSSFNGKKNVILAFFPQAFTGVCTDQMCTISDSFGDYEGMDTEVLGISVDGTFVQKAFAKDKGIKHPLLSDFNREVINKYGVVRAEFAHGMKNTAERAIFVIGKDGMVKYKEVTENPGVQVNFEKIMEVVKSLN